MSLAKVFRGSIWLSFASILANLFGLIYWILVSSMVNPATIGKAATILAIGSLIASTTSLGIPTGVMRFLGIGLGHREPATLGRYFYSSLAFILVLDVIAGSLFLALGLLGGIIPLDPESIIFTSILIFVGMNGWPLVLVAFFNSTLETEYISIAQLVTGLSRILISVPLIFLGLNFYGLMLGYVIASIAYALTLLIFAKPQLRRIGARPSVSLHAIVESLRAGLAMWIPSILTLAGQWLGVLGLSGLVGSQETGTYFIAYAITSGILALPMNLLTLMFPVLSGMNNGRKRAMGRAARLAMVIMYPIALVLIAYPAFIPSLLGEAYLPASGPIMILAAGFLLTPLINSYTYYAYAIGKYAHVTLIGLAENLPRIILYLLLIRGFAETGAASSFSLGFISSLLAVIPLARRTGYLLNIKECLKILAIPFALYITATILTIPPIIGIPIISTISYLSYIRLKIITKKELEEISTALLSKEALRNLHPYLKSILKILYGESA